MRANGPTWVVALTGLRSRNLGVIAPSGLANYANNQPGADRVRQRTTAVNTLLGSQSGSPDSIRPHQQGALVSTRISADSVREQVGRIAASRRFSGSDRQCRFLRLLAEETVQGRGGALNEERLGVEVFGRREPFDPRSDPIVRTELSRLRAKLKDYYEVEGRQDPLLIEFPPKSLAPALRQRDVSSPGRTWSRRPFRGNVLLGSACVLAALGLLGYRSVVRAREWTPAKSSSIAVLPLINLSSDRSFEYFSDGLTDELIDRLAEVEGLHVVSRSSVFQFKEKRDDVRKIGAQLGAGVVLEGTVRKEGDRLRVATQLVNVDTGYQLRSDVYDRQLTDVLAVQEEIARQVVQTLRVAHVGLRETLLKRFTQDPEAYNLYLEALYHQNRRNEWELGRAIDLYQRTLVADPTFAPAYAGLAESYTRLTLLNAVAPREAMPRAKSAAERAVREAEDLEEAHTALGVVRALYDWDWQGAEREFRRALELDPRDSDVREAYAMHCLVPQGRLDDGLAELQHAQLFDPFSPAIAAGLGTVYVYKRQPDAAILQYERALQLDPDFWSARFALAALYARKDRPQEALNLLAQTVPGPEDISRMSVVGYLNGFTNRAVDARKQLEHLQDLSQRRFVSAYHLAPIQAALGEKDLALDSLEKAVAERCPLLVTLNVDPRFESLRSEARFRALLKRLRLAA